MQGQETVIQKFEEARSNFDTLKKLGASILHGVDATKMKEHPELSKRKFDRIIFNFPHAGFHGREDDDELFNELPSKSNGHMCQYSELKMVIYNKRELDI